VVDVAARRGWRGQRDQRSWRGRPGRRGLCWRVEGTDNSDVEVLRDEAQASERAALVGRRIMARGLAGSVANSNVKCPRDA
jgi:hypothetical protein